MLVAPLPAPRFLALCLGLIAVGLTGLGAVNVVVDPFALWRVAELGLPKPAVEGRDRMHKAHLIARRAPATLVFGTSRAQVMWPLDGGALNGGVNAGQPIDWLRMVQHARRFGPLTRVVIGLDLLAFDKAAQPNAEFSDERFAVSRQGAARPQWWLSDVPGAVFSWDALKASLGTVRKRDRPSYLDERGSRTEQAQLASEAKAGGRARFFLESERAYLGNYACADPFEVRVPRGKPTDHDATMAALFAEAHAAGAEVHLYFSPQHARHLQVIEEAGQTASLFAWRAHMAALVEAARAAGQRVWLHDFALEAFDEPLDTPPADALWWESSHARRALGARLWPRVTAPAPPFDPAASEAQIRGAKADWDADHAAEIQEIRVLAQEILPATRRSVGCAPNLSHPTPQVAR